MNLDKEIKVLMNNYNKHSPESLFYKKLKKIIEKNHLLLSNYKKQKKLKLGRIGTIKFPFSKWETLIHQTCLVSMSL